MNKPAQIFLVLLVTIASIVTFLALSGKPSISELKNSVAPAASLYPQAKSVSEKLNFINDKSEAVNLSELTKDKWALLYFGYASCPDVCPIDLSKINLTYQLMENNESLQVVFISVDPSRDLGSLSNFAGAFNSSFQGLTANQTELISISKTLGVYHEVVKSQKLAQEDHSSHDENHSHGNDNSDSRSQTESKHYDIDHTSSYLLFSPDLKLTALLTSPHEPAPMAKAIDEIIVALR